MVLVRHFTKMNPKNNTPDSFEQIKLQMHPRVLAALGAGLVTNDVVAVIELVKNSYDAFAQNAYIRFANSELTGPQIIIEDDGIGMTKELIQNVWCVIATPYKELNPRLSKDGKERRVVGEKGLGRLSISRLGHHFRLLTQSAHHPCFELIVDWSELSNNSRLDDCTIKLRKYPSASPFDISGTLIEIGGLHREWDEATISNLEENLARLISPFKETGELNIFVCRNDEDATASGKEVRIESPSFLSSPKYRIHGNASETGDIKATYIFKPLKNGKSRQKSLRHTWEQVYDDIQDAGLRGFERSTPKCGAFDFEIRAWDIAAEDTDEISEKFNFQKSKIRKAISVHKGISVYRDGVLVLPKSDNARDWLGLDLRRISKVGNRLSTSQVVGYVAITGDENPGIVDTSDRERLVSSDAVLGFEQMLMAIVGLLEIEREQDRVKRAKPIKNLFEDLSTELLIDQINEIVDEGGSASQTVPLVEAYSERIDSTIKSIEERLIFYSRMATVGTICNMLVHEIRNRTTVVARFLEMVKQRFSPFADQKLDRYYALADDSLSALDKLADTFSPLASHTFTRRKRKSVIEDSLSNCISILESELRKKKISVQLPKTRSEVIVDPGELETVFLNIFTNAIYWLGLAPKEDRRIRVRILHRKAERKIRVWIDDTGPGIDADALDKIFLPGVTRRPSGIGMGLTIASEIISGYGGVLFAKKDGALGGATFGFDIPCPA